MSFHDELDAGRVYAVAFELKELTICFRGFVDRRLACWSVPPQALSEQDRAAIEGEVMFDALSRAATEGGSRMDQIIPNAVDEAVRLILIHLSETAQAFRSEAGKGH